MKAHRGEILARVLAEKGIKKTALAKLLGVHRNTVASYSDNAALPDALMLEIGQLISYDFSKEIAELGIYRTPPVEQRPSTGIRLPQSLPECQTELLELYRKYSQTLEELVRVRSLVATS